MQQVVVCTQIVDAVHDKVRIIKGLTGIDVVTGRIGLVAFAVKGIADDVAVGDKNPRWGAYRFRLAADCLPPTTSAHRLQRGLPGYLILFDPHAFVPAEYMDTLTHDIFEANVYVFTPKGKVIELVQGSTPVDFAYHIHTRVGDTCVGALVNGVMMPLNTILKTGDLVEIKTNKNSNPSEGWLDFVKTNGAKAAIRKYISKKNADLIRDEKIAKGRQSCIDAFHDRGIDEEEMMKCLDNEKLLDNFGFDNVDDLFIGVSGRKPVPSALIAFLNIKRPVNIPTGGRIKTKSGDNCPVYCPGVGKIAIALANCCTPLPGDDITGYVTKGKGVVVHRKNCPNVINEHERLVTVLWRDDIEFATYPVDILIEANDRNNLVVDIMSVLTAAKVSLSSFHARLTANGNVDITATLMVSDAKRLNDVFNIIRSVSGIYSVSRVTH